MIGVPVAEEPAHILAGLPLDLRAFGLLDRLRAELGGHHVLDLELLLGGEREKLIGGLLRLERAFRALAARDDLGERLGVGADIVDDLALHAHRLAERRHRRVEA